MIATFTKVGVVAPHRPVHGVEPSTCKSCGGAIGWKADHDPVHAVAGQCKCGAALAPFAYRCQTCNDALYQRLAEERAQRLANAYSEVTDEETGETHYVRHSESGPVNPERQRLFAEAVEYIKNYTGNFGLILDLRAHKAWGTKWYRLSDRQIEVVLAAKKRDAERKVERVRNQTGRDLTSLPIGRTYAAVDNAEGGVTFLIIDRPKPESKWSGWVFVKQQVSNEERKLGSQRPGETYVGQWPSLIDKVLDDPVAAVVRYGMEIGQCGICNRKLTNEESREAGIGPVCLRKLEEGL